MLTKTHLNRSLNKFVLFMVVPEYTLSIRIMRVEKRHLIDHIEIIYISYNEPNGKKYTLKESKITLKSET